MHVIEPEQDAFRQNPLTQERVGGQPFVRSQLVLQFGTGVGVGVGLDVGVEVGVLVGPGVGAGVVPAGAISISPVAWT